MDFHQHKDKAKQNTTRLVVFLTLAVLAISLLVSLILMAGLGAFTNQEIQPLKSILLATPATAFGIGVTSLVKTSQIRTGGGAYVATSMGGRLLDFTTSDSKEKQLANIVEEIAIASAMPAPDIYILDNEPGINAFAAGWTPDNSVIGVTRGALQHLDRNELQGVVAHEFSHIYNGDTKIKTKLIGLVFGIVAIAFLGRLFLNQAFLGRRSKNNKNDGVALILIVGIALLVVGYAGSYFARLIQSAVSRQREFLADASAVQFTRDPDSLGRALEKIGAMGQENKIMTPHVTEANHLFFTSALRSGMNSHPPLHKRIQRLLPSWNGEFTPIERNRIDPAKDSSQEKDETNPTDLAGTLAGLFLPEKNVLTELYENQPEEAILAAGVGFDAPVFTGPTVEHVLYAQKIINRIPQDIQNSLRTQQGAVLTLLGLLVTADKEERSLQLANASKVSGLDLHHLDQASKRIAKLDRSLHLPAIDLGLRSLRHLSYEAKNGLIQTVRSIEASNNKPDLFRWVLRRVFIRHLTQEQSSSAKDSKKIPLAELSNQATLLLAVISGYNGQGLQETQDAFDAALAAANLPASPIPPLEEVSFLEIDQALKELNQLDFAGCQTFITASATAAMYDGKILAEEAELIRVIADAIGQPVPPLLPTTE